MEWAWRPRGTAESAVSPHVPVLGPVVGCGSIV